MPSEHDRNPHALGPKAGMSIAPWRNRLRLIVDNRRTDALGGAQ
jgi:hypothetical protein